MQIPETLEEIEEQCEKSSKTKMNIGPFVNLLTDFGFKKVFGQEESKPSLIRFLNVLLFANTDEKIQSIDFLPNEDVGEYVQERKVIFDLKCITNKKETIIVEMQKARQEFFKNRAAYYGSKFVVSQAIKGGWNFDLNKVYVVSILDFPLEHSTKVVTQLNYLDADNPGVQMDFCTFVFVELPRFKKKFVDCTNDLEQWLYVIKNLGALKDAPKSLQEQNVWFKFFELANIPKDSSKEYLKYMQELQVEAEFQSVLKVRNDEIKAFEDEKRAEIQAWEDEKKAEIKALEIEMQVRETKKKAEIQALEDEKKAEIQALEVGIKVREADVKEKEKQFEILKNQAIETERANRIKMAKKMLQYGVSIAEIISETQLSESEIIILKST